MVSSERNTIYKKVTWKEISSENEPESFRDLFKFLFLDGDGSFKHENIGDINNYVHYYANKLTSTAVKDADVILEPISISYLLAHNNEFEEAKTVLNWFDSKKFIQHFHTKELSTTDRAVVDYVLLLDSYVDTMSGKVLTRNEIKVFYEVIEKELSDNITFNYLNLLPIHVTAAEVLKWIGEVIYSNYKQFTEVTGIDASDIATNYFNEIIKVKTFGLGLNKEYLFDLCHRMVEQFLEDDYFKVAITYFISEGNPSDIRRYFKGINKSLFAKNKSQIEIHLNQMLDLYLFSSNYKEELETCLNELGRKKYLIPHLVFTHELTRTSSLKAIFNTLMDSKKYAEIVNIYENWLSTDLQDKIKTNGDTTSSFNVAFAYARCNFKEKAKVIYENIYQNDKENTAVINNLAVIYYENLKDYDKALSLLEDGKKLEPEDEYINRNIKTVQELIEEREKRPSVITDRYFKKIDKPQRSILFTIYRFSTADDDVITQELLSRVTSFSNEKYLKSSLKQLMELELITYSDEKGYVLDDVVYKLIQDFKDPKLERQIVKASDNKLYRPIFYHESEINLYRVLLELFPQQLVFPNMDLKAIIDVDKIRDYIDPEVMDYLFKAHVDFAIISNVTYLPILAIEKDSDYQDKSHNAVNASRKNLIFQTSGLPLIRIRFNSAMDMERLKEEVKLVTKDLILQIKQNSDPNEILKEFNLKTFGIYDSLPDIEELREKWKKIVGETIFKETKDISLDTNSAIVQIQLNKSVQPIIEFGLQQLKERLYETFPMINAIQVNYV